MRERIPIERYTGNVALMAAMAVTAGYRPANAYGALAFMPAAAFGVAHYSAVAVLEERLATVKARGDALVKAAEAQPDPTKVLESLATSADERAALLAERDQLEAQIKGENERRRRDTETAAQPTEQQIADQMGKAAESKPPTPFASWGDQLKAVHAAAFQQKRGAPVDPRLTAIDDFHRTQAAIHGASELVGADGGFLVQTDFNNELLGEIIQAGELARRARTVNVGANSNGVKFNVFAETSRATGSRSGGVRVYWLAEGGQKTASRPKMDQIQIDLAKMAAMYVATDELLADTTALESLVRPAFVEEFAFVLDDAMYRGTGAGQPLGILNSDVLVTVSKETGQDADSLVLSNIDRMLIRLLPRSLSRAAWFINTELQPQLWNLVQEIGTGGVPVWQPPGSVQGSPYGRLRGLPVVPLEYASAPGDLGDIVLADWSEYLLVRKGGIQQASSIHVYFDTDETAFRWVLRVNGRPWRKSSVTPYKGTGTLSPFVTLQAR